MSILRRLNLLEKKASLARADIFGRTPFHIACSNGCMEADVPCAIPPDWALWNVVA